MELRRTIARMASEIVERLGDPRQLVLVGIVTGGRHLALRLADAIASLEGVRPATGYVDITLYRDDLYTGLEKAQLGDTRLPDSDLSGRGVVLVDDVLFTGRTVRAALDELMDYGRPRFIKLVVLVDRGHRELPIAADVVGKTIPVTVAARREGDPPVLVSDPARIMRELGWRPRHRTLAPMVESAWNWMRTHPQGYRTR
jgi:pyrimidine operon attenuation protein/uracil phosphoribosyltransferase